MVLNQLCDQAARDHRLTEPNLVGHEEPVGRVGAEVAIEYVLDRLALERLELR